MNRDKKNLIDEEKSCETDVSDDSVEANEEVTDDEPDAQEISIDELVAENQRLKNEFLRAYADAENVKKRCQQELEKNVKFAIADFAKGLLPVADNLQRAIDACCNNGNDDGVRKGIELTQNELMKVFDRFGIHKMDIMGKIFDPNFHQVVQEVEDKSKEVGTVVAEIQTGYMIHDRILREAMVVVTK